MAKKSRQYYEADTGFYGVPIKICFSEQGFNQAVIDSKITTRHSALDIGIAESHHITQEGTMYAMLGIVFNLDELVKLDDLEQMGVIYHEVSHTVTHIFQFIGEDPDKIGDETRSYLGEHLFKQVFSIYATARDIYERTRKGSGESSDEGSKKVRRALFQMAEQRDRSPGSDSITSGSGFLRGVKDYERDALGAPKASVPADSAPGPTGTRA